MAGAGGFAAAVSLGLGSAPSRLMSTLPRKCAPSAMAIRGAVMSPSTAPFSRMLTMSTAVILPVTRPRMSTDLANSSSALILPLGPTVNALSRKSILPSNCPSMVRFSLPLNSPLMTTDLPMLTTSLEAGLSVSDARLEPPALARPARGCSSTSALSAGGRTTSSRFHMKSPPLPVRTHKPQIGALIWPGQVYRNARSSCTADRCRRPARVPGVCTVPRCRLPERSGVGPKTEPPATVFGLR